MPTKFKQWNWFLENQSIDFWIFFLVDGFCILFLFISFIYRPPFLRRLKAPLLYCSALWHGFLLLSLFWVPCLSKITFPPLLFDVLWKHCEFLDQRLSFKPAEGRLLKYISRKSELCVSDPRQLERGVRSTSYFHLWNVRRACFIRGRESLY